jgi:hypothetical protein
MILLLALFLFQAGPAGAGVVTGVVRMPDGRPAANVRVFAIPVRDTAEVLTGTVFESLSQTDEAGKYRLEVPPGRYYVGSGAVIAPTYYPGRIGVSEALPITVAAGAEVRGMDFANLGPYPTPRQSSPFGQFTNLTGGGTGSLVPGAVASGTIRLQDGTPARGMEVIAVPFRQPPLDVSPRSIPSSSVVRGSTDHEGRYRLNNLAPGSRYYIVSGMPSAPSFYPGTQDLAKAVVISTIVGQAIPALDFTVSGFAISGRVTAAAGALGFGARITVSTNTWKAGTGLGAFFSSTNISPAIVDGADGAYSIVGVPAGSYHVGVSFATVRTESRVVEVSDRSVTDVNFSVPVVMVSGKVLFEDGSVPDGLTVPSLILSSVDDPDVVRSTAFTVSGSGTFGRLLEIGEYRLDPRSLTGVYSLKSATAGSRDLLKETFPVTASGVVYIEIRLAK